MKKKIILIILLLISFILGFIISFIIFKSNNKEEIKINELNGNMYVTNIYAESYIKFISDNEYEYRYITIDDTYKIVTGTYKINDKNIKLDNKKTFTINDNILIDSDNLIYFNSTAITSTIINIQEIVEDYVNEQKKSDPNLSYPKSIKIDLNECISNNDNMICKVEYNVYFDNYIKAVCDEQDNDKNFYPYTKGIGYCESNYVSNTLYFEIDSKNELNKVYTNYKSM